MSATSRHTAWILTILVAVGAALAILLYPRQLDRRLASPGQLSEIVRSDLRKRMLNHGNDMYELIWSTIQLDYDGARLRAEAIVASPTLARPLGGDATELNAQLPARFFQLQDEFKSRAARLAAVAATRNADALADAYGQLARACVACHEVYLHPAAPTTTK